MTQRTILARRCSTSPIDEQKTRRVLARAARATLWGLLLASFSAPVMAQTAAPCDSFQRDVLGLWVAVEPATIDLGNGMLEVMPGHRVGTNVARLLDVQCR
jgi:hypothetical protein